MTGLPSRRILIISYQHCSSMVEMQVNYINMDLRNKDSLVLVSSFNNNGSIRDDC